MKESDVQCSRDMTCCDNCYDSYLPYRTSLRDPYMKEIVNEKRVFSLMTQYDSERDVTKKCTTAECETRKRV